MPQPPEAPPDAFGGALQAIALGFAAGFGGKTVSDQIAQQRQNSWEAWQRNQEAKLRREEMDRRDRQFAMSLDMQRTEMEYRKSRDMKDDEARDKAKMEADIGTDAARISAEADLGPLDPNLPMSEVNRKLEDKRVGSLEMRAITREDRKASAQATQGAEELASRERIANAENKTRLDIEGGRRQDQRDKDLSDTIAEEKKTRAITAARLSDLIKEAHQYAMAVDGKTGLNYKGNLDEYMRIDREGGGVTSFAATQEEEFDALKKQLRDGKPGDKATISAAERLAAMASERRSTESPTAPDSRPALNPDTPRTEAPKPPPTAPLTFGARAKAAQRTASEDARKVKASKRDDAIKKVLEGNPNLASEIEAEIAKGMNGGVVTDEILIEKVKSKINSEGGSFGSFDRPSVDLAEEIKRALQKMRAENRRR